MRVFNFFPSFFSLEFHDNPDVFTPFLALDRENFLKFLTTLTNKRAKLQQDIQHAEELCVNLNSGTQARKDVSAQIAAQKVLERGIRIVYRRILCFLDASSHLYKRGRVCFVSSVHLGVFFKHVKVVQILLKLSRFRKKKFPRFF